MSLNVQLVQVNSSYGNQYFIPYSVGLLKAYSVLYKKIRENYFEPVTRKGVLRLLRIERNSKN